VCCIITKIGLVVFNVRITVSLSAIYLDSDDADWTADGRTHSTTRSYSCQALNNA